MAAQGPDDARLRKAFLEEAGELAQRLGESLQSLESAPDNREQINEVFRLTHSLKSESAFMGFVALSDVAHAMEDVLGLARDGRRLLDGDVIDHLFAGSDLITEMMAVVAKGGRDSDADARAVMEGLSAVTGTRPPRGAVQQAGEAPAGAEGAGAVEGAPAEEGAPGDQSSVPVLADADRRRLGEARERGEGLWRVTVLVDPEEPMKFPRAYLVFANLEQTANVVASVPPLDGDPADDSRYARTAFYVTTAAGEDELRLAGAVDQISEVAVERLEYAALLSARAGVAAAHLPAAAAGEDAARAAPLEKTSIRVETRKLDDLWSLVAELVLHKSHISRLSESIARGMDPVAVREELTESFDSLEKISGGMQQAMRDTRMIPISVIFAKFPRLVRDLSRKLEKPVDLSVSGEETEIDRSIVEALSEPLTHIIRNSLDHGLEFPEERVRMGKPEKGRIAVSAQRQGGTIVIEVSDDGRGMDTERIRQKALAMGLPGAAEADEAQLHEMVFLPGFSTKDVVTDLSGRGVGMDVVATRVRGELKGDVELASEPGQGTRVTLRLPLSLTIVNSLLVSGDGHLYAIPLSDVDGTVKLLDGDIGDGASGEISAWMDEEIPVHSLAALLGSRRRRQDEYFAVVIHHGSARVLLIVDELIEEREIVIKPLDDLLNYNRLFSGVSVLEDGRLAFILDTSFIRRENF
ncbi:MAG TPA: chemotaxis protein CheA [Spirochaetia bacterium]|nr:chemotaxis protein CheA [Spirochaetia bacterium]